MSNAGPQETNAQVFCSYGYGVDFIYFFHNKIWVFPAVKYCSLAFKMKAVVVEALSCWRGDANPVVP